MLLRIYYDFACGIWEHIKSLLEEFYIEVNINIEINIQSHFAYKAPINSDSN